MIFFRPPTTTWFRHHLKPLGYLDQRTNKLANKQLRPRQSHPALWYEDYPISLIGGRQSPIHIQKSLCTEASSSGHQLPELQIRFPDYFSGLRIRNPKDDTYFGWRIDVPYDLGDEATITGGPLKHRYKLIQFHAHWGKDCNCGSEHVIDGQSFSAELHFVYWNFDLYSSARKAAISSDGLSVVAVFLQATKERHFRPLRSLDVICDAIPYVKYKGSNYQIRNPIDIREFLPENRSYFTYPGSLTTPPLWQTVTWIIFENPILCTAKQINAFRKIQYYPREEIKHGNLDKLFITNVQENIRPVQPLNGRQIIYVRH